MTQATQQTIRLQRGGRRKGSGRKAVDGASNTVTVAVSLTRDHQSKLRILGGSVWLRSVIDREFSKLGPKAGKVPAESSEKDNPSCA